MRERPRFRGFHPEAFRFFRRLARSNHKPWFDRNRALYEEHVAGALKGLFEALAPRMLALDPGFEVSGKTGRNFSRINRDIRFARDKSPYRRNLYLYFIPRGAESDTRLYVGLSAEGVTCGYAARNGRESPEASGLARLLKPRRANWKRPSFTQLLPKVVTFWATRAKSRNDCSELRDHEFCPKVWFWAFTWMPRTVLGATFTRRKKLFCGFHWWSIRPDQKLVASSTG